MLHPSGEVNARKLVISIAFGNELDPKKTIYVPKTISNYGELIGVITTRQWSPIVYRGNKRRGDNFASADVIALDVDHGTPLSAAIDAVKTSKVSAIIGTTKSHQVCKGNSPACDRYRIILPTKEICRSTEDYQWTVKSFIESFGADTACKDLARFFFPCTEIAFANKGTLTPWAKYPDYIRERKAYRHACEVARNIARNTVPRWIAEVLAGKINVFHNRHNTIWRISCALAELGYGLEEIQALMRQTPLVEVNVDQPFDFERTSSDGWRAGFKKRQCYQPTGSM